MKQRVLFALSSHGYGHLGQTTPVLQALRQRRPDIEISVRSHLPAFKLREKFGEHIHLEDALLDIGMIQQDALAIDLERTAQAYADFHRQWDTLLAAEKRALSRLSPDLIVANIPYLTLAAAGELAIPAIAFCSLNWGEIYQYFFESRPGSGMILQQIMDAYNQAACFLQPEPAMAMPGLDNAIAIGPVAQIGRDIRRQLHERLGIDGSTKILLVSLGGMELGIDCDRWPRLPGMRLLVPESWKSRHPDTVPIEALGYPFADLMRSCDVLVAKPGYGSFVEAACTGTPVLSLPREQWPEVSVLIDWLGMHGTCLEISQAELQNGELEIPVARVTGRGRREGIDPSGVNAAVDVICNYLR